MSSSCLLQLVINDCGPAEPGRSSPVGQKISEHDLRLHANLSCCGGKRLSLSFLSHPVGFASSPMMVQLICLLSFNSYMQRKKTLQSACGDSGGLSWWPTRAPFNLKLAPRTRTGGNVIQPYCVILYNMLYMLLNIKFWGKNLLFLFRCVSWEASESFAYPRNCRSGLHQHSV